MVSCGIKGCPPTPFDINRLHQNAGLSRQRSRVRVSSSPHFFSSTYRKRSIPAWAQKGTKKAQPQLGRHKRHHPYIYPLRPDVRRMTLTNSPLINTWNRDPRLSGRIAHPPLLEAAFRIGGTQNEDRWPPRIESVLSDECSYLISFGCGASVQGVAMVSASECRETAQRYRPSKNRGQAARDRDELSSGPWHS